MKQQGLAARSRGPRMLAGELQPVHSRGPLRRKRGGGHFKLS